MRRVSSVRLLGAALRLQRVCQLLLLAAAWFPPCGAGGTLRRKACVLLLLLALARTLQQRPCWLRVLSIRVPAFI